MLLILQIIQAIMYIILLSMLWFRLAAAKQQAVNLDLRRNEGHLHSLIGES